MKLKKKFYRKCPCCKKDTFWMDISTFSGGLCNDCLYWLREIKKIPDYAFEYFKEKEKK